MCRRCLSSAQTKYTEFLHLLLQSKTEWCYLFMNAHESDVHDFLQMSQTAQR